MAVSVHADGQGPPSRALPSPWADFLPQALANAAGTLIAAVVGYLWLSLFGVIKPNHKLVLSLVASLGVGVALGLGAWVGNRTRHFSWPTRTAVVVAVNACVIGIALLLHRAMLPKDTLRERAIATVPILVGVAIPTVLLARRRRRRRR